MSRGRYGKHGGQYVPETLMNEIIRLEEAYEHYKNDPEFVQELDTLLKEYAMKTITSLLCRAYDKGFGRS